MPVVQRMATQQRYSFVEERMRIASLAWNTAVLERRADIGQPGALRYGAGRNLTQQFGHLVDEIVPE